MTIQIEYVSPDSLVPAGHNPRTISRRRLKALARLLDAHGFVDPVIARRADRLVVAGHQRLRANALRARPDEKIPCVFLDDLSDARAKALNVAMNNPRAQGSYDQPGLARLLAELAEPEDQEDLAALAAMTAFGPRELADLIAAEEDPPRELELGEPPEACDDEPEVTVIFEMTDATYRAAREALDALIAEHGLNCRVQFGGPYQ